MKYAVDTSSVAMIYIPSFIKIVSVIQKLIFFLLLLPRWSIGLIYRFLDHFRDGRTPWTGDQLVARPLPKHRTT
jgi:hypothetical protein